MKQDLEFGASGRGSCSKNLRLHPRVHGVPRSEGSGQGFDPVKVICPSPKGQAEEEEEQTGSGQELGCSKGRYHAEPPLGCPQLTRVGQPSPALRVIKNEASDRFVCVFVNLLRFIHENSWPGSQQGSLARPPAAIQAALARRTQWHLQLSRQWPWLAGTPTLFPVGEGLGKLGMSLRTPPKG